MKLAELDRRWGVLIGSDLLLALLLATIFVVPVLPVTWHRALFALFYVAIFVAAAISMGRHRRWIVSVAIGLSIVQGVAYLQTVQALSEVLSFLFFAVVVVHLINRVARTRQVTATIILAAVNGYLLLGMMAAFVVMIIRSYVPDAYSLPPLPPGASPDASRVAETLYYTFVTFTTVGYGDITPRIPLTRSLATFIGVMGQLYVAVIIALLVGKYAGQAPRDTTR